MLSWWEHLSFSQAGLWMIVIVGIIVMAAVLCRTARRPEVLDPPHWATKRGTTEAAGKVRRHP